MNVNIVIYKSVLQLIRSKNQSKYENNLTCIRLKTYENEDLLRKRRPFYFLQETKQFCWKRLK